MSPPAAIKRWSRPHVYRVSQTVVLLVLLLNFGGLLLVPQGPVHYVADVLIRTWVVFIGVVMAHEGFHGHLGRTRRANAIWGGAGLLPVMVPWVITRRTHLIHHEHTNEPDRDPEHFLNVRRLWELPFRAATITHYWFFWMSRRGLLTRNARRQIFLNYLLIAAVYAIPVAIVGLPRVLSGMLPVLALVPCLFWIPFAHGTHAGYSTGAPETRTHNYYGRPTFWFSFGLAMHRVHHGKPYLAWMELLQFVRPDPRRRLLPRRDIHTT